MDDRIELFKKETSFQGEMLELIVATVDKPILYESGKIHHGFRFLNPGAKHFCILKAARAISGLNAAIALLEKGFIQEIAIIIRSIIECTSHIDYVLAGLENGQLKPPQMKFVNAYFEDFRRNDVGDFKRPHLKQKDVHKVVGGNLDELIKHVEGGEEFAGVDSSKLMSNIYLTYSNYVHSRYPEVMDLFGESPERFHLEGIRNTAMDYQNI